MFDIYNLIFYYLERLQNVIIVFVRLLTELRHLEKKVLRSQNQYNFTVQNHSTFRIT